MGVLGGTAGFGGLTGAGVVAVSRPMAVLAMARTEAGVSRTRRATLKRDPKAAASLPVAKSRVQER